MPRRPHCLWAKPERSSTLHPDPDPGLGESLKLSLGIAPASLACTCAHFHKSSHTPEFLALVLWERARGRKKGRWMEQNPFAPPEACIPLVQPARLRRKHCFSVLSPPKTDASICSPVSLKNWPFTPTDRRTPNPTPPRARALGSNEPGQGHGS